MAKSLEARLAELRASLDLDRRVGQMREGQRGGVPGLSARAESMAAQTAAGADPTEVAQRQLTTAGGQAAPSDVVREPDAGAAIAGGAAAALPMVAAGAPAVAGAVIGHKKLAIGAAVTIDQLLGTNVTQAVISHLMR